MLKLCTLCIIIIHHALESKQLKNEIQLRMDFELENFSFWLETSI